MKAIKVFFQWIFLLIASVSVGYAQLTIEITKSVEGALPIAILPFSFESNTPGVGASLESVITTDLYKSGRFSPLPSSQMPQQRMDLSEIDYAKWQTKGIANLVIGQVEEVGVNQYRVAFQLIDVFASHQQALSGQLVNGELVKGRLQILLNQESIVSAGNLRAFAHYVSDRVYQTLLGEPGAFSTRIAYITVQNPEQSPLFKLQIADADGFNPMVILKSHQPLLSPAWSHDARQLAYVSFEHQQSEIFIQDIFTGKRRLVSGHSGINSAPAWSPGDDKLAITLSKDGNPEIYILDVSSGTEQRITHNRAIDTEAQWAPDGQSLIFTSDRGGKPQIYQVFLSDGKPARITFEGDYNAKASFTSDGRSIVMVHRKNQQYHIAMQDLSNGLLRILTDTSLDESPSIAPNDSMVIYAMKDGNGQGLLGAVSIDGRVKLRLPSVIGDVREPAWSPFL